MQTRRSFTRATTAALTTLSLDLHQRLTAAEARSGVPGKIQHSVCKWCYPKHTVEQICEVGKEFGLNSVELVGPEVFPILKKYGYHCAMVDFPTGKLPDGSPVGGITKGWNRAEHHATLSEIYRQRITEAADAGFNQVICFSGNRDGLDDEKGLEVCSTGLKGLMAFAEEKKVTLVMELLNSRVNHPGYQCDKSAWGIELVKRIGSDRFKLLYDIYHMQIMEGDVSATITKHHAHFAHYHTGGVPGRHEIDETQELYYPAIMKAITATGFTGHVAQEFEPARPDALASLRQGVEICTLKA
jgi:hydroxypyruvate isomerase